MANRIERRSSRCQWITSHANGEAAGFVGCWVLVTVLAAMAIRPDVVFEIVMGVFS